MAAKHMQYKEIGYHLMMARGKAVGLSDQTERTALLAKIDKAQEFLEYLSGENDSHPLSQWEDNGGSIQS